MVVTEENRLYALCHLLNDYGRSALQARISLAMDNDDFISALETEKANLTKILPISMLKKIYGEKEEKPTPLANLPLRSVLVLCAVLPQLKDHFKSEDERQALLNIDEILLNLYNALVRFQYNDQLHENVVNELTEDSLKTLQRLGLNEFNLKKKLNQFLDETSAENNDGGLTKELRDDELIVDGHLKMIAAEIHEKRAYNEPLPDWLEDCWKRIKDIKNRSKMDLEGFSNIRKSLQKTLQGTLKCGFCKELLVDPRTFPCLHSFCLACIKRKVSDKIATCPTCNTRVAVGDDVKIDELPLSFVVGSFMKVLETCLKIQEREAECKFCIQTPVCLCLHCSDLFCQNHSVPLYHDNHVVAPLAHLVNEQSIVGMMHKYCPQHKKLVNQFCPACLVPLCTEPICVTWHGQHAGGVTQLIPLNDALMQQKQKTLEMYELLQQKMERVNARTDAIERNQIDVANLQENIRQSIVHFFADIDAALQKAKQAYLQDLDKAADHCMQSDEQTRQVLESWKRTANALGSKLESFSENIDNGLHVSSVTELFGLKSQILMSLADTGIGATIMDVKGISYPESSLRNLLQQTQSLKSQIIHTVHSRGWEPLVKVPGVKYILPHRQYLYVIKRQALAGYQLLQYDLRNISGDPVVFCESNMREFQSVAFDQQGLVYIPEDVQHALEIANSWRNIHLKRYVNLAQYSTNKERAKDIQINHLNTIAKILFKTSGRFMYIGDNECVCEIKPDGELVRKFNFVNMISVGDFAVDPFRDMLFITDSVKHSLLIFNCKQQTMVTVGEHGQGATPDSFSFPTGVAVDNYGHLFVADTGNSRIQVFEINGKFVKLIQFPLSLKDIMSGTGNNANQRTILHIHDDYLYLLDSNSDTVWRMKYF